MKMLHYHMHLLLAGMCGVLCFSPGFIATAYSASSLQTASPSAPPKRWVEFELSQAESTKNSQTGKPVTLTIFLGGETEGMTPVVVNCESIAFQPQTVTLKRDAEAMALKGTVTLEPILMSRTSAPLRAARIQVTLAQPRQGKLERLMQRIVYVTLDQLEPAYESSELPPLRPEESQREDIILDEAKPSVAPVETDALAEENLVPDVSAGNEKAYWQNVSYLISQSWARLIRGIRREPSGEAVKVRFKLFPNGRAQLIRIEKGSGAREIDEAGIYAVVNAQPFPPIPSGLGEDIVDVHVQMRTGGRQRSHEAQSGGGLSVGKFGHSGRSAKK